MKDITIAELYSLDETIAKDIFEGATYPWEVLPKIHDLSSNLGVRFRQKNTKSGERISGLPKMQS